LLLFSQLFNQIKFYNLIGIGNVLVTSMKTRL